MCGSSAGGKLSTFNAFRTDALRVYDSNGVLVFGTKAGDRFPTSRGAFDVQPGRYTIAAYYHVRALADNADVFGTRTLPYTFRWTFTPAP
jgi:hypothetical protein